MAPATPVVILYLHGGAYCFGSAGSHRGLAAALSKAACAHVVALNYTLAADAAFPAALHDALDAYAWLCSHRCAVLSAAPSDRRVVVGGDSAGGGLTMALLMALSEEEAACAFAAIDVHSRGVCEYEQVATWWAEQEKAYVQIANFFELR